MMLINLLDNARHCGEGVMRLILILEVLVI
jgi:hypothetical protein